jgi:hypothetical protein
MRPSILVVVLLGAAACESSYVYHPAAHADAEVAGRQAAIYTLPSAAHAQGDLRVASFGVSKIKPEDQQGETVHALHVREVVSNSSQQPWTVDTRQQNVELADGRRLTPSYARSDAGNPPVVVVPPAGKRTIDLFFPLPPREEKASKVPTFDVVWNVDVAGQPIAQRTPFERLRIEPYYASAGWGYPYGGSLGWGPYGWYDPMWGPAFIGPAGWYW